MCLNEMFLKIELVYDNKYNTIKHMTQKFYETK